LPLNSGQAFARESSAEGEFMLGSKELSSQLPTACDATQEDGKVKMTSESKPTQPPHLDCDWQPEDLEWLAQHAQQKGDGGSTDDSAPTIEQPTHSVAKSTQASPVIPDADQPREVKLPSLPSDECGRDPEVKTSDKQPLLNRLLVSQLAGSVPQWLSDPERSEDAIELYQKFDAQDAIETVLSALAVGLFNASMDGFERAGRPGLKPEVRQMELKLTHSGTAQLTNLIKTLQAHRGLGVHEVNVGSVNVSSGANAIVGNVAPRQTRKE
jgi:hypothetical protein